MRSWGCRGAPALRRSRAPIASSPRSITPTANKNDPKAAARFSELNSANEIIGDEDKRKQFDRGEIDAEGKPRFQGFPGGDPRGRAGRHPAASSPTHSAPAAAVPAALAAAAFEDILNSMFGGAAAAARGLVQAVPSNSIPAAWRSISISTSP